MNLHSCGLKGGESLRADVPGDHTFDAEFGNSFAGLDARALRGIQVNRVVDQPRTRRSPCPQ